MNRALIGLVALFCVSWTASTERAFAQDCDTGTFEGAFAGEVLLPQNLNCQDRQEYWFTDQGSQLIPYVWFLHLEQAGSQAKFSDPLNMDRYRYLPQNPTALNPDGLPIGFTKGSAKANKAYAEISRDWLGMTCAACHTGQVEFNGAKYLIDGAPSMADFETMMREFVAAMQATLDDEAKFDRFAATVLADDKVRGGGGAGHPDKLRHQLEEMTALRSAWNKRNEGTSDYGHARLDAIGAIFNETSAMGLDEPGNIKLAGAPVSYPFIWDTPQHDVVQWNGSVTNAGPGALGRNVGEVLGVFGALTLNTHLLSRSGHASSINIANLGRLEELMWQLWSPKWRDTGLPPIDEALAKKGGEDYKRFCIDCHHDIKRTDPQRRIKAQMFPISGPNGTGTDPRMATDFLTKTAKAPQLTGRVTRYWGILSDFKVFELSDRDKQSEAKILGYSVLGAITRAFFEDPKATLRALKVGQPPQVIEILERAERHLGDLDGRIDKKKIRKFLKEIGRRFKQDKFDPTKQECFPEGILPCYKARPLNGIWATAPYLHNGSVRTMRQLLLPADQREKSFKVGTREFDPVDMGFKNEGASTLETSLTGNSNAGHEGQRYGNEELAKDKARMDALLEYLKTL